MLYDMQSKINNGHYMPFCWLYFQLSTCEQIPLVWEYNQSDLHLHKYIFNIVRGLMLYCFQSLCIPKLLIRCEWIKISLYIRWFSTLACAFSLRKQVSYVLTNENSQYNDLFRFGIRYNPFLHPLCSLLLIRFRSMIAYK